jgi:hypothetical protein
LFVSGRKKFKLRFAIDRVCANTPIPFHAPPPPQWGRFINKKRGEKNKNRGERQKKQ